MLAYEYPILGVFWTTLMVFLWVAWLLLLFRIFGDIFRSKDMGGWGKALWCVFVIIFPLVGTLVYLIVRGSSMTQRDVQEAENARQAFDEYVRETAGSASPADELAKLKDLEERGAITAAEFEAQKARILS